MTIKSDKELLSPKDDERMLLELAAKAAGITWTDFSNVKGLYRNSYYGWWNPLTDDGDALRLAVKLNIQSCWFDRLGYAVTVSVPDFLPVISVREDGKDPYAATRRAIVRAAAMVGESM